MSGETWTEDYPVIEYPLGDVLEHWRPGSHEWSWGEEAADLIRNDGEGLAALVENVAVHGLRAPLPDEEPIILGVDGRVWSGHHRIIAALLAQQEIVYVAFSGDDGEAT